MNDMNNLGLGIDDEITELPKVEEMYSPNANANQDNNQYQQTPNNQEFYMPNNSYQNNQNVNKYQGINKNDPYQTYQTNQPNVTQNQPLNEYGGKYIGGYQPNAIDYQNEADCDAGAKISKVLGITMIVISVASLFLSFNLAVIAGTCLKVWASTELMKGKNGARIFLGICTIATLGICIYSVATADRYIVDFGSTILGIVKVIYLAMALAFGVGTYFLFFDKRVSAFCKSR